MAKATERTSFTKDVQGRYLCNDISEANAWQTSGGRPFDIIVVGALHWLAGQATGLSLRRHSPAKRDLTLSSMA